MKFIHCLLLISLLILFASCKSSDSSYGDDYEDDEYAEEDSPDGEVGPENVLKEYIRTPQDKATGARRGLEDKHKAMLEAAEEVGIRVGE